MKETNFKQTEVGRIPEDWNIIDLNSVSQRIGDGLHGTPEYNENGEYFFINGNNLVNGKIEIDSNTKMCSKEEYQKHKKDLGHRTVLISINGTLGNVAIYNDEKIILGKSACYLNIKKDYNLKYIKYVLKNKSFQEYMQKNANGTTIKNFSLKQMREFRFGIPFNIIEQESIAKILSDLDSKIELNNKMNRTLEATGQALFKKWFIDGRKEEWRFSTIGKELKTFLGGTPRKEKKEYWTNGTVGWINSGEINNFPVMNFTDKITEEAIKKSAAKKMPKRTVVLPFVISVGKEIKISVLGVETSGNQSVLGILENDKMQAPYIYYWIQYIKKDIYSHATGGAQQHINKNNVDYSPILCPDSKTLKEFNIMGSIILDKIITLSKESQYLSEIRNALLPKLMSGEIRVND